ncbi:MAG: alkaline phosphatase family protein [Planctomycetota bacterium]|nr:alkaline phosphatase family protein [Planctomycetota bacterium]
MHVWNRILLAGLLGLTPVASASSDPPRLILQITVDGLRYDLLTRSADRYGEGGLRLLLDQGAVFANAHYQHANTETIVGHATLATGAHPSLHGMIGNVWYDAETQELAYNIEDPDHPIVPVREETITGEQLDPSQRLARTNGRSPRAMLAETLADKLLSYTGGKAKVYGISGKDRSAVAMAGQGGKAYWYSTDSGDFVTSTWYHDAYPDWIASWNAQRRVDQYENAEWTLLHDTSTYKLAHQDDRPYETDLRGYGRTFPHRFGTIESKLLYTQLLVSPVGDQLLVNFAKHLVANENIGQDDIPDYLAISFSAVDAVNHIFGPSSLENEDVVRQLDRTLADLLAFIDEEVGLDKTLIVLSADHGMPEAPEYMAERGFATGRLTPDVILDVVNRVAKEQFGLDDVVRFYFRPYVYLKSERIIEAGRDPVAVREALAEALTRQPGIYLAATKLSAELLPDSNVLELIRNNYHAARAGDIYIVQEPYWFNYEQGPVAVMHGSPWNYDTHVPVIFLGPGIPSGVVQRAVQPADVAPTIAALLGMSPPASAQGTVLTEVFGTP